MLSISFFSVGKKIYFVCISFKQCVYIVSMSLFKYFEPIKDKAATSSKRAVYKDVDKIRIARYTCENGNSKAASKFKSDFPKLN